MIKHSSIKHRSVDYQIEDNNIELLIYIIVWRSIDPRLSYLNNSYM